MVNVYLDKCLDGKDAAEFIDILHSRGEEVTFLWQDPDYLFSAELIKEAKELYAENFTGSDLLESINESKKNFENKVLRKSYIREFESKERELHQTKYELTALKEKAKKENLYSANNIFAFFFAAFYCFFIGRFEEIIVTGDIIWQIIVGLMCGAVFYTLFSITAMILREFVLTDKNKYFVAACGFAILFIIMKL